MKLTALHGVLPPTLPVVELVPLPLRSALCFPSCCALHLNCLPWHISNIQGVKHDCSSSVVVHGAWDLGKRPRALAQIFNLKEQ